MTHCRDNNDSTYQPGLLKGISVKINSNQRYDSTWITSSVLSELANMAGIPLQVYRAKNRCAAASDKQLCGKLVCGHTIKYMRKVSSGHSPSIETAYSIKGFCLRTVKAQTRLRSKISFLMALPRFSQQTHNVVTTSLQRHDVATTLLWRCVFTGQVRLLLLTYPPDYSESKML